MPPLYNQSYINVGRGPTVILLHGLFGNLGMWIRTVDALKEKYHVIVPRLPIFDLPVQHTNIKYLAKVLHDFIEWNKLKDVTLVGHGVGGQLALLYASVNSANVKKLVLTASTGLLDSPLFSENNTFDFNDYEKISEKVKHAFYYPQNAPKQLIDDVYSSVHSIPSRLTIDALSRSSKQSSVSLFLHKIDHPVLLLWGLEDKVIPPEVALHFYDYLPNAKLHFIHHCGHLPMTEKPEEFTQTLLRFLS